MLKIFCMQKIFCGKICTNFCQSHLSNKTAGSGPHFDNFTYNLFPKEHLVTKSLKKIFHGRGI